MNSIELISKFSLSKQLHNVPVCNGKYTIPLILTEASMFIFDTEDKQRDEEFMDWWTDILMEDGYHSFQTENRDTIKGFYKVFTTSEDAFKDLREIITIADEDSDTYVHIREDRSIFHDYEDEFHLLENNLK